jgi:mono/diheme cytochrome c family protein
MRTLILVFALVALATVSAVTMAQEAQDPVAGGKDAFNRVCKICHGSEGSGEAAPRLVPFEREYDEVLGIVRDGRGEMPPISQRRISDDEVRMVVAYLRSLSRSDQK